MDISNCFIIYLVIQLLANVNADELVSSLLGSVEHKNCTAPFLSLNTIGYIQCQKTCIRFSDCGVLQYSKSQLECRLYVGTNCENTQDSAGADIYLNRADIHEAILGNCPRDGCPASTCVRLRGGGSTCVVDRVLTHYHSFGATFVDIDGTYYGFYPQPTTQETAKEMCESYSGTLAVLDTPRKIRIATDAFQQHVERNACWVGGYRTDGEMKWSTGVSMQILGNPLENTAKCAVLGLPDGFLYSQFCTNVRPTVCRL